MSFSFVPLDQIAPSPVGGGLLPSVSRTQQIVDQIARGGRPQLGGPVQQARAVEDSLGLVQQARAVEDSLGLVLGAAAAGVAQAHGWHDGAAAAAGVAALVYGTLNGHSLLRQVGHGLVAPYVARLAARTFAPGGATAAPEPAPTTP